MKKLLIRATSGLLGFLVFLGTTPSRGDWQNCSTANYAALKAFSENDTALLQQANRSFEDKFSIITSDIRGTSADNISRLKRTFLEKRPGFEKFLTEAEQYLPSILGQLSFETETRLGSLGRILDSGSIQSIDERMRIGTTSLGRKKSSATTATEDGAIGEQDVVFLAIREPFTSKYAQTFGDATLTFDTARIIDKGYFSPFAFAAGLGVMHWVHPSWNISCGFSTYKQWVFGGQDAFHELLKLSIAQILWEKELDGRDKMLIPHLEKLITEYDRPYRRLQEGHRIKTLNGEDSSFENLIRSEAIKLEPVFATYQQSPNFDSAYFRSRLSASKGRWDGTPVTMDIDNILRAYQGFPSGPGELPPSVTSYPQFWEFKVPRELSLDSLRSIAIPFECEEAPSPELMPVRYEQTPMWCAGALEEIQKYSARTGRKFRKYRAFHRVHKEVTVFEFIDTDSASAKEEL